MIETKFDFDDILITPKTHTDIKSRYQETNPFYEDFNGLRVPRHFPVITAPMDTVVDLNNYMKFWNNQIAVALPRTLTHQDYLDDCAMDIDPEDFTFFSYGLEDFKKYYIDQDVKVPPFVLIDVANGHMKQINELVKAARKVNPNITVMVGNIANPDTYYEYAEAGVVDLIRVGIGNGNGCLTTKQTGVGYPNASLIRETYLVKQEAIRLYKHKDKRMPKIVADGGMKEYADIIKALGLGADYVMVGSIFNKAIESRGQNYWRGMKISQETAEKFYDWGWNVKKQFYGMSTKIAQKKMGKTQLRTSEGVVRYRDVEYTLSQWRNNFYSYLISTMSYCEARTLDEFIGKAHTNMISENAYRRFNK